MTELKNKLKVESQRIEEDAEYSAKGHFNASERWSKYHLYLGVPFVVITAIASGSAFNNMPILAGGLALISTALTTVLTFLNPSERAETHKAVGGQHLTLRNQARIFREIEIEDCEDLSVTKKRLLELSASRDEINQKSPSIPRKDYELARKDINEGCTVYQADKEEKL